MFQRRTPRPLGTASGAALGIASLGVGLILATPSSSAGQDPDTFEDAAVPTVVELSGGDRVRVTTVDAAGRSVLDPLPRADGTTPGLIVTTDGRATSLQSTDVAAAPALLDEGSHAPAERTAVAADDELVELRFDAIGRDGRGAIAHVNVFDVETGAVSAYRTLPGDPDAECTSAPSSQAPCILLPRGTYSLMALVTTMPQDQPSTLRARTVQNLSLTGDPEVTVFRDRTVTFDARRAERVAVRTPGRRTKVNEGGTIELGYTRTAANGQSIGVSQMPASMLDHNFYQQPTERVRLGDLSSRTRLRLEAPDIELSAPGTGALHPEYYERVWFSDTASQFPAYDGRARLRVVDVEHATAEDLAGRDLRGALAVAERSDAISVADQANGAAEAGAELVAIYNDGPGENGDPNGTGTLLDVPTLRLARAEGLALRGLRPRDRVTARGESTTPYVYDLVIKHDGRVPDDPGFTARSGARGNLSTQVRAFHGQPTKKASLSETAYPWEPGETFSLSRVFPLQGDAQSRTELRVAGSETRWSFAAMTPAQTYNNLFPDRPTMRMSLRGTEELLYAVGGRSAEPVGAAPITAAPSPVAPIERSGDRMRVDISGFLDADGNHGTSYTVDEAMSTRLEILAGDVVVGETTATPRGIAQLPPGDSQMTITFTSENLQPWAQLSKQTETTWSFASSPVPVDEVAAEPVILADYDVDVDLHNRARGRAFGLDLSYADGADAAAIGGVTLEASYDDGRTWRAATVRPRSGGGHRVVLPKGRGFVSVRLNAADDDGSSLDQRIIRAWYVA